MSTHTPEPWEREGLSVFAVGRGAIAVCPNPRAGGTFECMGNACLIAAAPELLAALEHLIRDLEAEYGRRIVEANWPGAHPLIAKARGENG